MSLKILLLAMSRQSTLLHLWCPQVPLKGGLLVLLLTFLFCILFWSVYLVKQAEKVTSKQRRGWCILGQPRAEIWWKREGCQLHEVVFWCARQPWYFNLFLVTSSSLHCSHWYWLLMKERRMPTTRGGVLCIGTNLGRCVGASNCSHWSHWYWWKREGCQLYEVVFCASSTCSW